MIGPLEMILGAPGRSTSATQVIIDAINAIGDFNINVLKSTNGNGGTYLDTGCTSEAGNNGEVLGWKTFGNNPPATNKNLQIISTGRTPTTSKMWYKDFCTTNVSPLLIVRSTTDKYVRFYNGQLGDSSYETNPGQITALAHPIDIVYFFQWNFCTEDFEANGDIRWDGSVIQWASNGIVGGNLNGSSGPALGDNMIRLTIDAGGTATIYLNGVSIATGARTFSTTERSLGTSSHPLTANMRAVFLKQGIFTAQELTDLTTYSNTLWPRTGAMTSPFVTNSHQATFNQWNGGTKTWEPGRNLVPVFQGGNGVAGTHKYYWIYWSSSDVARFPAANKLDEHYKIPGSLSISTIAGGNTINSVSVDGVVITSAAVPFNTSATQTAADLVTNINAFQTRYLASSSGSVIQLIDKRMLFNDNIITFSATGFTPTKVDPPVGAFLTRTTYAVTGQIFNGIEGNGTTYVARVSQYYDSAGTAGDPVLTKWHNDNIA